MKSSPGFARGCGSGLGFVAAPCLGGHFSAGGVGGAGGFRVLLARAGLPGGLVLGGGVLVSFLVGGGGAVVLVLLALFEPGLHGGHHGVHDELNALGGVVVGGDGEVHQG